MATPCIECEYTGRIWPFKNKGSIPKECKNCLGNGFIPGQKLSPMGPTQGNYPGYYPPPQGSYTP